MAAKKRPGPHHIIQTENVCTRDPPSQVVEDKCTEFLGQGPVPGAWVTGRLRAGSSQPFHTSPELQSHVMAFRLRFAQIIPLSSVWGNHTEALDSVLRLCYLHFIYILRNASIPFEVCPL